MDKMLEASRCEKKLNGKKTLLFLTLSLRNFVEVLNNFSNSFRKVKSQNGSLKSLRITHLALTDCFKYWYMQYLTGDMYMQLVLYVK